MTDTDRTLTLTRHIAAPVARVWAAWTDPAILPRWFGPDGIACTTEAIDLREGGEWRFTMVGHGQTWPNRHRHTRWVPQERIEFLMDAGEGTGEPIQVVVTMVPENGGTRLTQVMTMPTPEALAQAQAFNAQGLGMQTLAKLAAIATARRVIMNTFLSLDGVMQAPGGPGEDTDGGFAHGGWTFHYWDEVMMQVMGASLADPVDLLMGRRTYDIFAAHWPNTPPEEGAVFNDAHKYVATHRPESLAWGPVTALTGDIPAQLRAIKAAGGRDLSVQGSAGFGQVLLEHGLVDQMNLWVFPLTLGTGKRRFGTGTQPAGFRLTDHKVSGTGVLMLTYVPAELRPAGSFALPD